jgi:hypothetical protein
MHGCIGSHWAMGMAHSSVDLPPTAVKFFGVATITTCSEVAFLKLLLLSCAAGVRRVQRQRDQRQPGAHRAHR